MKLENSIKNTALVYAQNDKIEKKNTAKTESSNNKKDVKFDKLELSLDAIRFQPIREKINQGFYDSPEVLKSVTNKLYAEVFGDEN